MSNPTAPTSESDDDAFDDGLVERLGDIGAYVSSSPAPIPHDSFVKRSGPAGGGSLSARLAEASRLGSAEETPPAED
jgi:hypothetical protein